MNKVDLSPEVNDAIQDFISNWALPYNNEPEIMRGMLHNIIKKFLNDCISEVERLEEFKRKVKNFLEVCSFRNEPPANFLCDTINEYIKELEAGI